MAGGTRLHRWIYEASLGRDERSIRFRKEENGPPAVRKLSVSLDRADNVIEGGPPFCLRTSHNRPHPAPDDTTPAIYLMLICFVLILTLRVPHSLRGWQRGRVLTLRAGPFPVSF